jgi:hypothetical protein
MTDKHDGMAWKRIAWRLSVTVTAVVVIATGVLYWPPWQLAAGAALLAFSLWIILTGRD